MLCAPTVSLIHYKPSSELSEPLLLIDKRPSELSESLLLTDESPSDCSATLSLSPLIIREIKEIKVIDLFFKRINHLSLFYVANQIIGSYFSIV
jgi:hypothetical protein